MEKHIMGENGISYTLGEDGLYYPDLYLPEETEYPIGKYGMLRKSYLQEHRKELYLELRWNLSRGFSAKHNVSENSVQNICRAVSPQRMRIIGSMVFFYL